MRELIYAVEGKVANLRTFVLDNPGHGGACHEYIVKGPGDTECDDPHNGEMLTVHFQNGPINEDGNGINGVQNEDLLAILIDRLEGFQSGPYACTENAYALIHCQDALKILQDRTRARIARNVEGTHKV